LHRELALQIFEQFKAISALHSLDCVLITGGVEHRPQAIDLARRPHIVIATPGRLADHIMYSGLDTIAGLRKVKCLVLDEADRLLADGEGSMLPDVGICLDAMPPPSQRQTCLFTATMTENVMKLRDAPRAKGKAPVAVCEIEDESAIAIPPTLKQTFVQLNDLHRDKYLHVLLQTPHNAAQKSIMVFCNRTKTVDMLERILRGLDHSVTSLHSDLPQSERNSNLSRFRANASRILVATDVASRGLDIPEVGLVINFDIPRNPDDYVHRVGRTARAGRKGEAISLVGQRDVNLIHAIESRTGAKMVEWSEEGVNLETRLAREGFKEVGIKKREVMIAIDEGRDVKGNRKRGKISRLQ
jgi:ATP-dependent RNA helicase DDX49/DBP8